MREEREETCIEGGFKEKMEILGGLIVPFVNGLDIKDRGSVASGFVENLRHGLFNR